MYSSVEAEHEVQRTIKRAELTACLRFLRKARGPIKDNKGIIDGLRKGEKECIKPGAGDADLWKTWDELHRLVQKKGILVEVAHVKVHRTKKEREKMTQFERSVAEVRADTMKQERERGSVRSLARCSQLSQLSRTVEGL